MSNFLKVLAGLLLLALLAPTGTSRHERVVMVAVDGFSMEHAHSLMARGVMPALERIEGSGVSIALTGGPSRDPSAFWTALFEGRGGNYAHDAPALWDLLAGAERETVLIGLPGTHAADSRPGTTVLPGSDPATGFIGDNVGRVANGAALRRGNIYWPYRSATNEVQKALRARTDEALDTWFDARAGDDDTRTGRFRIEPLGDDVYYLSPVYRRVFALPAAQSDADARASMDAGAFFVADSPSVVAASSRLGDYLIPHAARLAKGRALAARRFAERRPDVLVYFEPLLGQTYEGLRDPEGGQLPAAGDLVPQYRHVDATIARIAEAAGPEAVVVLVWREPEHADADGEERPAFAPAGHMIVSNLEGSPAVAKGRTSGVLSTVLSLAGVDAPALDAGPAFNDVTRRFRSALARRTVAIESAGASAATVAANAEGLDELGVLAGEVTVSPEVTVDSGPGG